MMSNVFLVKLSETDKLVIFAFLMLFILVFVLIGYLGFIVLRIMKHQGKKVDEYTHDVVVTKVIKDKKHFQTYASKKNWILFFKQSYIPLLIILFGTLVLIIRNAVTNDFAYNIFDYKKTGFNTIFFVWDFGNVEKYTTQIFGFTVLKQWPDVINTPHFEAEAWASYIFFFSMLIGGAWYLITVQRAIARTWRIHVLKNQIYSKKLDGYNFYNSPNPTDNSNNKNITL